MLVPLVRWTELPAPATADPWVLDLGARIAKVHMFGRTGRIPVPRALAAHAQLVAFELAVASRVGVSSTRSLEAALHEQMLGPTRLLAWQAGFVSAIESTVARVGLRRVGSSREYSAAGWVEDLRTLAARVPGAPPELTGEGREARLLAAFEGVRLTHGPPSLRSLTARGVARRWCLTLDLPFPAEARRSKTGRRVGEQVTLSLPHPEPLERVVVYTPQTVRPVPIPEAGHCGGEGDPVHLAVATALASASLPAGRPLTAAEAAVLTNIMPRLAAVAFFVMALADHVQRAERIVERTLVGASGLGLGQAMFLHLVGWSLGRLGRPNEFVELVTGALPHLVSDGLATALVPREPATLARQLGRRTAAYTVAREWVAACGLRPWPAQLQPSKGR